MKTKVATMEESPFQLMAYPQNNSAALAYRLLKKHFGFDALRAQQLSII
jgi:hypothetical protein